MVASPDAITMSSLIIDCDPSPKGVLPQHDPDKARMIMGLEKDDDDDGLEDSHDVNDLVNGREEGGPRGSSSRSGGSKRSNNLTSSTTSETSTSQTLVDELNSLLGTSATDEGKGNNNSHDSEHVDGEASNGVVDKEDIKKSIMKGKGQLSRSRQKAHKEKGEGMPSSLHHPTKQPSSRKISSSSHVPGSSKSRSNKSEEIGASASSGSKRLASSSKLPGGESGGEEEDIDDLYKEAAAASSDVKDAPVAAPPRIQRTKSGSSSKEKFQSHAGSLATPRRKGGSKKLSLEDMKAKKEAAFALKGGGVGDLPAFCTPRRPKSSKKMNINANDMMKGGGMEAFGAPKRSIPKRSKSHQDGIDKEKLGGERGGRRKPPPRSASFEEARSLVGAEELLDNNNKNDDNGKGTLEKASEDHETPTPTDDGRDRSPKKPGRSSRSSSPKHDVENDNGVENNNDNIDIEKPGGLKRTTSLNNDQQQGPESVAESDISELESHRETDDDLDGDDQSARKRKEDEDKNGLSGSVNASFDRGEGIADEGDDAWNTTPTFEIETSGVVKKNDSGAWDAFGDDDDEEKPRIDDEDEVKYWICWACEYDCNTTTHIFCGMCGTGRDWVCPSCDHDNKSSFNFCGMCGTKKGRTIIHKDQPEHFEIKSRTVLRSSRVSSSNNNKTRLPSKVSSEKSGASVRSNRRSSTAVPDSGDSVVSNRSKRSSVIRTKHHGDEKAGFHDDQSRDHDRRANRRGRGREDGKHAEDGEQKPRRRASSNPRLAPKEGSDDREERRRKDDRDKKLSQKRQERTRRRPSNETELHPKDYGDSDGDHPDEGPSNIPSAPAHEPGDLLVGWKSNDAAAITSSKEHHDRVNRIGDVLATPSIKKVNIFGDDRNNLVFCRFSRCTFRVVYKQRLLKMGGKVGGKAKSFIKGGDMPLFMEDEEENEPEAAPIKRTSSDDNLDQKPMKEKDGKLVPATPSLKKRLLKMKPWGKSEHGKGAAPPPMMLDEATIKEGEEEEETEGGEEFAEEEDEDDDPLQGLSAGLVVTARDMRPNRPATSRRTPARRKSDLRDDRRPGSGMRSSTGASGRVRRTNTTGSDDGGGGRRRHDDSDDGEEREDRRTRRSARPRDPLRGQRASEAESIHDDEY